VQGREKQTDKRSQSEPAAKSKAEEQAAKQNEKKCPEQERLAAKKFKDDGCHSERS
jgi:hypothetical protein